MSYLPSTTTIARIALFAAVLLAVLFLASQSFFPAFAQEAVPNAPSTMGTEEIDYDENDDGPVVVYTATDPEGETVFWSVVAVADDAESLDSGAFDITNGVLTFMDSPNFETPVDSNANNEYIVKVRASDVDGDGGNTHTIEVTVNVQNVNEDGEVTFSHPQPKEGTAISVTLMDEDRAIDSAGDLVTTTNNTDLTNSASTTWQWYRSETGSDPWTKVEEMATSSSYTPVEADVGHYLRATAMYYDFQDTDEQRAAHSKVADTNKVLMEEYINTAPMFRDDIPDDTGVPATIGSQINMSVPEDESLGEGDPVGQPITAEDIGEDGSQEVLTYTHAGNNSGLFTIDSASGQLKLAAGTTLDFETDPSYEVTVTANDPDGKNSTAAVTITLTDEDEAPTITEDVTQFTYQENATGAVFTYNATDEDAGDGEGANAVALSWTLSGRDAADFSITTPTGGTGELTFNSPPDFEAPADSNRDNIYNVTVEVADDAGNKDARNVIVTIQNQPEDGSISLTSHPQPEVGRRMSVRLDEPDGVSGSVSWEWDIGSGTATSSQTGGTTSSYTPQVDGALSVTASYTDRAGTQVTDLALASPTPVQARPPSNTSPSFSDAQNGARSIDENSPAGTSVGTAFDATDTDGGTLLYTLSGGDYRFFTLASPTGGLIQVAEGTELDFERKQSYSFTLNATDGSGARGTQAVTITVNPLSEDPEITDGDNEIELPENFSGTVETYKATDDENDAARPRLPLTWSLAGDDSAEFRISQAGVLTFAASPDFENAADADLNNEYLVTITVSDGTTGTNDATLPVTVTVINVDEDGEITGLPAQPKEEVEITVTLTDPDGPDTAGDSAGNDGDINALTDNASTTWQWFRSRSRTSGWALISATSSANENVNTNTRTPEAADVGYYLRATALYRDGQGVNKSTKPGVGVTARTVQAKEYVNSAPVFRDDVPDVTDEAATQGYQINMEVNEDDSLEAGDPVGDPVTAKDFGSAGTQETLIYELIDDQGTSADDVDVAAFTIDRLSGQLKLAGSAKLDAEDSTNNSGGTFVVTVKAVDPAMASSTALVTIQIVNVEEAPEFDPEDKTATPAENLAATSTVENTATTTVLSSYTATDEEDDNLGTPRNRTWSLEGADEDKFLLCYEDAGGVGATCTDATDADSQADSTPDTVTLRFKEEPNYETPADSGRNNIYNVTVVATDSDEMIASKPVAVTVKNTDEPGEVTFNNRQPEVGTQITATLTDPDGGTRGITWQWAFGDQAGANAISYTPIAGAASATYTPTTGEVGRKLQAVASYTDAQGAKKAATSTVELLVQARDNVNEPPEFPDADPVTPGVQKNQTRYVQEGKTHLDPVVLNEDGTTPSTNTEDPVSADDSEANGSTDQLTYTLSGPDARSFDIASSTGQISVGEDTVLDYEIKTTYTVRVTATDPSRASDTITVTIMVVNVNEPPTVSQRGLTVTGSASVSYAEDRTDAVQTYRAVGPDASGATWSLSGADASAFSIAGGALSFNTQPDFENAADANTDNVYNVTVMATMGSFSDDHEVSVTVTNEDEDGTVELTYDQNQVRAGVAITAEEPVDPDGGVINVSWQWESSSDGSTGWSDVAGATSAAYTPVDGDVGNFLRATASYTDAQGPGKSASSEATPTAVAPEAAPGTDGTVSLSPLSGMVSGDSVTATLTDADNPTGLTWVWQTSANGSTNWSAGAGSESSTGLTSTYTTTNADGGDYLRATVTYADDSGAGQTAESPATTGRVAIDSYDRNSDGRIDAREVVAAVTDYFGRAISLQRVVQVVTLYFSGLAN